MGNRKYNVAIVGATGAVGREMLSVLEERDFPVGALKLLASARSAGETLEFNGKPHKVEVLDANSFKGVEIGLFSAGASVSKEFAPIAGAAGCIVIDNTSCFRMDPDVPLVVPEVNPEAIHGYTAKNIIANPNCSTIQMLVALKPLHDEAHINRIVVSTYQAVSGAGQKAVNELSEQAQGLFNFREPEPKVFPHQIAFNCIPQIDIFLDDGYTKEETKMIKETQKIMGDDAMQVTATCVRVPVFNSHAESVNIETEEDLTPERAKQLLSQAPGVILMDDPSKKIYPLQTLASGRDEVLVGRIRRDPTVPHGLNLWIVGDNLRKGAALNAVQIAEYLDRQIFSR